MRRDRVPKTAPANGGKTCAGRNFEYKDCKSNPVCPTTTKAPKVMDVKETTTPMPKAFASTLRKPACSAVLALAALFNFVV